MTCGVQFDYAGYQNRVKIKGSWATLPIDKSTKHMALAEVMLVEGAMEKTLLPAIKGRIARPKPGIRRDRYDHILSKMWGIRDHRYLLGVNIHLWKAVNDVLGQSVSYNLSSDPGRGDTKTLRLFSRLDELTPNSYTYLAGLDGSYLVSDEVPLGVTVEKQIKAEGVPEGSILELIVDHDDPVKYIMDRFVTVRRFA